MLLNTIHYVLFYQIFDIVTESDSDEIILEEGKWTFLLGWEFVIGFVMVKLLWLSQHTETLRWH